MNALRSVRWVWVAIWSLWLGSVLCVCLLILEFILP